MEKNNTLVEDQEKFNWNRHWFTEQQIMAAPIEAKIEKLMELTSPAAVNTAFEHWIEDWLIQQLLDEGVMILEDDRESD